MGAPTIDIRCLGSFVLAVDGRPVQRWRAGKARDLFQFLLLRPGKPVSRESLCDALWPDAANSANTRSSLKVAAHMLRRILAEQFQEEPPLRLLTHPEGYLLAMDRPGVDFVLFDELIDTGHRAELSGHSDEATAAYREAVELYQGDFLSGFDAEWVRVQREWLRSRYLYALQHLCDTDLAGGDHLSVVRWCRRMIDVEPFHEEAYRTLMIAHARLGQLNQVRRWYEMCATRLHGELQIAPDPATEDVYARALPPARR